MRRNNAHFFLASPGLKRPLIKSAVFILSIFLTLFPVAFYLNRTLRKMDYFRVADVMVKENVQLDLSYLKGQNIFALDLRKESRCLSESNPAYKKIRLVRLLPNRIFVDFLRRKPLAYVRLYRYFAMDEDFALFDRDTSGEMIDLPVIIGLEKKILAPRAGEKYNIPELVCSLLIIRESKLISGLKDYKIRLIDLSNPGYISVFIPLSSNSADYAQQRYRDLEVKIGREDKRAKLVILASLLVRAKNELVRIKYIDLRFQEPVVRFRNAE